MKRTKLSLMVGFGFVLLIAGLPSLVLVQPAAAAQMQENVELTSSLNPSQQGQAVTFTAYVCLNNYNLLDPQPYATGSATFMDGPVSLGSVSLAAPNTDTTLVCPDLSSQAGGLIEGEATLTSTSLPYGNDQISATYPGDSIYASGTSNIVTQNVQASNSSSALTSSPNPSETHCSNASGGQPVTFTFTVPQEPGEPVPTGLVTFTGEFETGSQSRSLNQNGVASVTTVPVGLVSNGSLNQTFTASYSGDSNYPPFSASVIQTFKDTMSVSLSSSVNPSSTGQTVTFTANLSTDCYGIPAPSGSIIFSDNGDPFASVALGTATTATYTTSALPGGTQTITAEYSGDSNYVPSSQSMTQTVSPPVTNGNLPAPVVGMASLPDGDGYWLADAQGGVSAHGTAANYGSMAGQALNAPINHIVSTPDGNGYWLVAADGGTFAFGDAGFYGSMGGKHLNAPVVDIAPTKNGKGYWLVASDGGIFSFGDAVFHGSMGGQPLNKPVVGITADYATGGYWEVATDGGIFAFGAPFFGSTGNIVLNAPVNGIAATFDSEGYWFVASDGGIFAYGDAQFYGSTSGMQLNAPIVGMAADDATGGYWLVGADGSVFYGNAPNYGSD